LGIATSGGQVLLAANGATSPAPLTVAISSTSTALDKGSNPDNLQFDERGSGFARVRNGTADIGAFEFQTGSQSGANSVTGVVIGDGTTERSNVTTIKITFASAPVLTGTIAQEFTLTRVKKANGGGTDSTAVTIASATISGNVVTLSGFSGAASVQSPNGFPTQSSLADGAYSLTVNSAFTGLSSNFVLTDNGAASSNSGSFYRLAGDLDGNRSIGGQDINLFVAGFGANGLALPGDLNLDSSVGGQDINLFVASFGGSV
jgi:hypothetical protein